MLATAGGCGTHLLSTHLITALWTVTESEKYPHSGSTVLAETPAVSVLLGRLQRGASFKHHVFDSRPAKSWNDPPSRPHLPVRFNSRSLCRGVRSGQLRYLRDNNESIVRSSVRREAASQQMVSCQST